MPKKKKTVYVCQECGYDTPKWMGRCPGCGAWNTLVEETIAPEPAKGGLRLGLSDAQKPQPIAAVKIEDMPRFLTGSGELDRVLGGGIIPGSMVLIVGDPGVGKSSLTLRVCADVARQGKKVLYVTGEESTRQVRMRADRLQALADTLFVVSAGARVRRRPPAHRQDERHRRLRHRSCDEGRHLGRPARPRAHRRHRALLRGRAQRRVPRLARRQEPLRQHE